MTLISEIAIPLVLGYLGGRSTFRSSSPPVSTAQEHTNALRDARKVMEKLEEIVRFNFEPGTYMDANG